MPLATMPSAMDLMRSSLTLQPNLFQEFQPMGGVRQRPLSRAMEGWTSERNARMRNDVSRAAVNVFMTCAFTGPPGKNRFLASLGTTSNGVAGTQNSPAIIQENWTKVSDWRGKKRRYNRFTETGKRGEEIVFQTRARQALWSSQRAKP